MSTLISPSILSADFMNLERDVKMIAQGGADYIHFDVMDGHFVPNLTLGVPFVKAMKKICPIPLDVHLMISNPLKQLSWYLDTGADLVTVHIEAFDDAQDTHDALMQIKDYGAKCGISLNPETSASEIFPFLEIVDLVLVMSVHPGFGGQSFIEDTPQKVEEISNYRSKINADFVIEVDGGINEKTAPLVTSKGATILVAGNAIFGAKDPVEAMDKIRLSADLGAK